MFKRSIQSCIDCALTANGPRPCPLKSTSFPAGTVLCGQGEVSARLYLLKSGTVVLSAVDEDGTERSFSLRGPGALLCLEALRGVASTVEVRSLTPVQVCQAPVEEVEEWLGPKTEPARPFLELVLAELESRDEDASWKHGGAMERVARFLIAASQGESAPVIPKQMVARALGIRAETLSRCLTRLGDRGLIQPSPQIRVLDVVGLRAVAHSA